jgi:hypothetical protein
MEENLNFGSSIKLNSIKWNEKMIQDFIYYFINDEIPNHVKNKDLFLKRSNLLYIVLNEENSYLLKSKEDHRIIIPKDRKLVKEILDNLNLKQVGRDKIYQFIKKEFIGISRRQVQEYLDEMKFIKNGMD